MYTGQYYTTSTVVWGGLRNTALSSSIAAALSDFPGAPDFLSRRYGCLAASQLNYMLGANVLVLLLACVRCVAVFMRRPAQPSANCHSERYLACWFRRSSLHRLCYISAMCFVSLVPVARTYACAAQRDPH
jgi:hypothetical protein